MSERESPASGAEAREADGSQLSMTSVEDEKMEGNMMAVIGQNIKQTVSNHVRTKLAIDQLKINLILIDFYRNNKIESLNLTLQSILQTLSYINNEQPLSPTRM